MKKKTEEVKEIRAEEAAVKEKRSFLKSNRKLRLGATATAVTAVVIAVVVIFNVIIGIVYDRFPLSLDLTTDDTYTLSDQGRAVAKNADKDIEIIVFAEESFFSAPAMTDERQNIILRQFYRFTQEYNALSGGHITTTYLDPVNEPAVLTKYKEYNVDYGSILFLSGDQHRLRYMDGLYTIEYSGYDQVYRSRVEEVLASTVNSLCGGKNVTVTFLTGHGENTDLIGQMSVLYELNGYTTEMLNFKSASAEKISDNTEMLVIAGPTTDYSEEEIDILREWLKNDGKMERNLFVLCNFEYDDDTRNLYEFLEMEAKIKVTDQLIVETNSNNYISGPYGEFQPFSTINDSDLTDSVGTVLMPYTVQLEILGNTEANDDGFATYPLVEFSEDAELVDIKSYIDSGKKDSLPTGDDTVGMAYTTQVSGTVQNHIIVSGCYLFPAFGESYVNYDNEALTLEPVLNTCDLGDTIVLSAKTYSTPTYQYGESLADIAQYTFLLLPILLILISLIVFFRRRHL